MNKCVGHEKDRMNSSSRLKTIVGMGLGMLFLLTTAQAASFDCGKAASEVEKMICNDDELSKLDESLSKAYLRALTRTHRKRDMVGSQRQWLKNERNTCQDAACVKRAYQTRIKELGLSSYDIAIRRLPGRGSWPSGKPISGTYSRTDFIRDWSVPKETYRRAESKMILVKKDKNTFQFDVSIVGDNLHTCTLSGKAVRRGPYFEYKGAEPMFTDPEECVLKFWFQEDFVRLEHASGKCRSSCGQRAMLSGAILYRPGTILDADPTGTPHVHKTSGRCLADQRERIDND